MFCEQLSEFGIFDILDDSDSGGGSNSIAHNTINIRDLKLQHLSSFKDRQFNNNDWFLYTLYERERTHGKAHM